MALEKVLNQQPGGRVLAQGLDLPLIYYDSQNNYLTIKGFCYFVK